MQDIAPRKKRVKKRIFLPRLRTPLFLGVLLLSAVGVAVFLVSISFLRERETRSLIAQSAKHLELAKEEFRKPSSQQDKEVLSAALQKALDLAKRATELRSSRAESWEALGLVYKEMTGVPGSIDWLVRSFQRAVALDPDDPDLRTELGEALREQGKTKEARSEFERALTLDSRHRNAKLFLALLIEEEGDTEEAYILMRELALVFSEDGGILFQLGRMEYNRRNSKGAIELFERVIATAPLDSNARYALAVALEKEGRREEALQHFEKVLLLNPDNEDVRKKIEALKQ